MLLSRGLQFIVVYFVKIKKIIIFLFVTFNVCFIQTLSAAEPKISFSVKALFKNRAMIEVNGKQRFLSAGEQSPEGVKLISSDAKKAKIFCHGNEYTLYINQTIYSGIEVNNSKLKFKIPKKLVPGRTIPFIKEDMSGMTKFTLKTEFKRPSVMRHGQGAIWIGSGNKLLRFDIKKEAWGVFDSTYSVNDDIRNLAVSDKFVVFNDSMWKKDKKITGLSLFDEKDKALYHQLDTQPQSYQFVGDDLWFLNYGNGLGFIKPKKSKPDTNHKKALLDKDRKNEKGNKLSAKGDNIWYSSYTKFKHDNKKSRLNEVCVTHYSIKNKVYTTYTREQMQLNAEYNCEHVAVSDNQVWVSHGSKHAGLSMFDVLSKQWTNVSASANNILIGGQKIILENNQLWMLANNQLIGLNTEHLHADIVLGDAVIKSAWQSVFYVKEGYVWFATKENPDKKYIKPKLVLYKIPVN